MVDPFSSCLCLHTHAREGARECVCMQESILGIGTTEGCCEWNGVS